MRCKYSNYFIKLQRKTLKMPKFSMNENPEMPKFSIHSYEKLPKISMLRDVNMPKFSAFSI